MPDTSTAPAAKTTAALAKSLAICIVTDAWHPQVNGVVRTLDTLRSELETMGHTVHMLTPAMFKTMPCPTYPEIRLALGTRKRVSEIMANWHIDAVHIATEGPLGWAARRWCIKSGRSFTTAYHTAFPEYIAARTPLPASWFYPLFRKFHSASSGVLVATPTVRQMLTDHGFKNIVPWTRGVDSAQFHPMPAAYADCTLKRPVQLYVGRVAVEKNIEAFLGCKVPGTKVVVGEGPVMTKLKAKFPDVQFWGAKSGAELAAAYAVADVFVFPSKTDTFGLVMIEALAAGVPVAAYPVQGPVDVLGDRGKGPFKGWKKQIAALNNNLEVAIQDALTLERTDCAEFAKLYNWQAVAEQFLSALQVEG
ncbi:glycosyltransferase family 4 protein [Kordiimonas pumila]|uniref:Glycosyltransferase family 4 protein n=1 Tax=Kordiimonas pumila TaxID=2161677 RepID=A0ABV7D5S1_9PROT|nr:glycosyltransferase family 1 protein [Kordiimonas pumila]